MTSYLDTVTIETDQGNVTLGPGELYIVPEGVRHRPISSEEAHILLIEQQGAPNTREALIVAVQKETRMQQALAVKSLVSYSSGLELESSGGRVALLPELVASSFIFGGFGLHADKHWPISR